MSRAKLADPPSSRSSSGVNRSRRPATSYLATWHEADPTGRRFIAGTALYAVRLAAVLVVLPLYARASGYDGAAVGLLVAAGSASLLLLGVPVMLLGGRGWRRHLLAGGPLASALGLVILVAAPEPALPVAAAGAFLSGAGGTTFWTLGDPILAASAPAGARTRLFALKFFALITGMALGGALGGWVPAGLEGIVDLDRATALGTTLVFLAVFDLAQAATFWSLPLPHPPRSPHAAVPTRSKSGAPWPLLLVLVVPEFGMAIGYGAIKPFLALFLTESRGFSTATAGTAIALSSVAAGISVLALPILAGRTGTIGGIVIPRLLGTITIPFWFAGVEGAIVILLICLALALIDGTEAPYVADAMDRLPIATRTAFSGLYSMLWSVGSISASLASGRLQDASGGGFGAAFTLGIGGYLLAALWIAAVFPRLPRRAPDAGPITPTAPTTADPLLPGPSD